MGAPTTQFLELQLLRETLVLFLKTRVEPETRGLKNIGFSYHYPLERIDDPETHG